MTLSSYCFVKCLIQKSVSMSWEIVSVKDKQSKVLIHN